MDFLLLLQILVSLGLVTVIAIQAKDSSLGASFGGSSANYHTKQGVEKAIFYLTIALGTAFVVLSIINVLG